MRIKVAIALQQCGTKERITIVMATLTSHSEQGTEQFLPSSHAAIIAAPCVCKIAKNAPGLHLVKSRQGSQCAEQRFHTTLSGLRETLSTFVAPQMEHSRVESALVQEIDFPFFFNFYRFPTIGNRICKF